MEHKTKKDRKLLSLVSEFENDLEKGSLKYFEEKSYNQLIDYYEAENDLEKALDVTDLALDQYSYRSEFFIIKSRILIRMGDFKNAHELLDKAEIVAPFENEIKILRAKILAMSGETTEATQILSELKNLSVNTDFVEILLCESYVFEFLKEYDLMFNTLKKLLQLDSTNTEGLERMLLSVELCRSYSESIIFHKELLDENPYNYLAWYNLGHAYGSTGEYEEAIICLEYSFLINKNFESGYLDCADYAFQIKQYGKALDCYQELVKQFGEDGENLIQIAECQLYLNNTKDAKYNLYKALKLDPYNEELYFHLAKCYANEKSWYTAINAYHKAISIEDRREEFFLGLAKAYVEIENFEKSIFYFHKATLNGVEESIYWREYAMFLIKNHKLEAATEVLDNAEEFTFGADLLYCRASVLLLLDQKEEAYTILEEAFIEDFASHEILFAIHPEFQVDKVISGMIKYFGEDTEE